MRFSTIAIPAFFGAIAFAAPLHTTTETVKIESFYLRQNGGTIETVEFKIQPANVSCTGSSPTDFSSAIVCGNSEYRFEVTGKTLTSADLSVYKQTGVAAGIYGEKTVPVYCHAGGNGLVDFACIQIEDVSIELKVGA